MLDNDKVDENEEIIRELVRGLSDEKRKEFYRSAEKQIRDPDTYAVLNWLFIAGLHHFYLRKYYRGIINLSVFIVGLIFFFTGLSPVGIFLIIGITCSEIYALFRSGIIVQDYNNNIMEKLLKELQHD